MSKIKEEKSKPTNCRQCNKRLSKKRWYYRNGNYFCNKGCWKAFDQKQKVEKEKEREKEKQGVKE